MAEERMEGVYLCASLDLPKLFGPTAARHPGLRLRSPDEIAERFVEQSADAKAHPLPREVVAAIEGAATMKAPSGEALTRLRDLSRAAGIDIGAALDRFEARLTHLDALGGGAGFRRRVWS
jgi:hypothetical protein